MNIFNKFLNDNMVSERAELFIHTDELLKSLGHHDHVHNIENLIALHGTIETMQLLMLIESELMQACLSLTLMYHIVCRRQETILPYLKLLEFLDYIENTIESETVLYYRNDELDDDEQFLSWVEVFRPDLLLDISDLILEVTSTLVENIIQIHELRVDVVPVEFNETFYNKLQLIKCLKQVTNLDILPIRLIQNQTINATMTISDIYKRYSKTIYTEDVNDVNITSYNIIGFVMLVDETTDTLKVNATQLINLLYTDVKKVNTLVTQIDKILEPTGDLCKTMNTIS